jgi:MoxR-like ATPase
VLVSGEPGIGKSRIAAVPAYPTSSAMRRGSRATIFPTVRLEKLEALLASAVSCNGLSFLRY